MAGRHYGIQPGYEENSPPRSTGPIESYNSMQSHQLQDYAPAPAARSLPRRPVAPYERKPMSSTAYASQMPPSNQDEDRSYMPYRAESSTTPEEDNYGMAAVGGGLGGVAAGIANDRPRESGMQAMRDLDGHYGGQSMISHSPDSSYQSHYGPRPMPQEANSQSSLAPLAAHGSDMAGRGPTPSRLTQSSMPGYGYGYDQSMPGGVTPYQGDGYDEFMDPRDIADDGDDFVEPQKQRRSRFVGGAATGAGAAAGGASVLQPFASRDASGNYGPIPGNGSSGDAEKSEWLRNQSNGKKRLKWIVGTVIVLVIIGAVVGVVVGLLLNKSSGGVTRGSASDADGIWDINSQQVQSVLNNKNLHKVFPGMDYTPLNAQYPACLSNPPYQNDVTLDVAVLAQMTPAIRLYGTDCKQTEMVLKGIDLLGYNDTVKVWLGVWLSNNQTTNTRQLDYMYDILDTYPSDHFAGVIIGNEVLYRQDMTLTQLADQLTTSRQKIVAKGIDLPVATSDLGDNWNAKLAAVSDIVMSNVHPFFAGVTPDVAPGWTWDFWQEYDVPLATGGSGNYPKNIISETGWPSQGGNDCGTGAKCATKTQGAVAGIDEMNDFMDGWVCQSMTNSTTYFWFEAFDEPWKVIFDDPKTGDYWEPHWGLMDVNRNLKSGVKIPDCNGKTIDKPY